MTTCNTNTIKLHRVLQAPPERVYRAFLDANEAAAIAISNLPQVKWVEEDALGEFDQSAAWENYELVLLACFIRVQDQLDAAALREQFNLKDES